MSPDGRWLLSRRHDNEDAIDLWNLESSPPKPSPLANAGGKSVFEHSFGTPSRWLVFVENEVGSKRRLRALEFESPNAEPQSPPEDLGDGPWAFLPGGKSVAVVAPGGRLVVWDLASGKTRPLDTVFPSGFVVEKLAADVAAAGSWREVLGRCEGDQSLELRSEEEARGDRQRLVGRAGCRRFASDRRFGGQTGATLAAQQLAGRSA